MKKVLYWLSLLMFVLIAWSLKLPVASAASSAEKKASIPKYGGVMSFNHTGGTNVISAPADTFMLLQRIGRAVFEPLFVCDIKERIKPWLAESYEISRDKKVITIKCRKGIKFSDGTNFNAEAVKFNLELALKNNIIGSAVLRKIESYEITDQYTIKLHLKRYDATLLLILAQTAVGLMASPTAQQKPITPDNITEVHMVGTGPFLLDSWKRDTFVKFKKNPSYWQKGKPYLDGLVWNNVTDLTVSLMSFKAGQVNGILTLDPVDALGLQKMGYKIILPPMRMIHSMFPDGANPDSPFAKQKVREALEYAIDKKSMTEGIGMGFFKPAYQFAAETNSWYNRSLPERKYNPAKSKQLLKEAGYPNGVKTALVTDPRMRKDTLTAIQSYLKAAGFDCTIDMADMARMTDMTVKGWKGILLQGFPVPSNFSMMVAQFNTTRFPSMYRPAGWQEKWDSLLEQTSEAVRIRKMKELIKIMYDTCLVIPYQADSSCAVADKTVRNFAETYQGGYFPDDYRPADLWLDK